MAQPPAEAPDRPRLSARERRALTARLLRHARRYRGVIALALVTMVVSGVTESSPIVLAKIFVDHVLIGATEQKAEGGVLGDAVDAAVRWVSGLAGGEDIDPRIAALALVGALILFVSVLSALTTYANEYLAKYIASLVVKDLRVELMRSVLRLPLGFFTRRKMGDLISRFSSDTQGTFQTLNVFLSEVLLQPFQLVFAVGTALLINWRLGLIAFLFFPAVVIPALQLARRVHRRAQRTLVSMGEVTESLTQVLGGLRVVKAFRMEEEEAEAYDRANAVWLRRQVSLVKAKALSRGLQELIYGAAIALVLVGGSYLVITDRWGLTPGGFTGMLVAVASAYRPLRRLSVAFHKWQESTAAAARVFEVIDLPPESPDPPDAVRIGPIRRGIAFEEVSFAYGEGDGSGPRILSGVSFEIPAGRTVALVGPSGAGKSTIADLLLRFYAPTAGRITVDGVPLERVSRDALLDQVAVVSQQPFLFNASIRDNIAYGRRDAGPDAIENAARAAGIHDAILGLPAGYDTVVGERGASLSGGQLQRVTIARAILKGASLLVLDEATSSLDTASERAVQAALENLLAGRTALVIAHRLSTVVRASHIVVIEDGRIVEQGSHDDLLARGGLYARLYRAQATAGSAA